METELNSFLLKLAEKEFSFLGRGDSLQLDIRLDVLRSPDGSLSISSNLEDKLKSQGLGEKHFELFSEKNSVYCYHCESYECGHSHPQNSMQVFYKYASNGLPMWIELSQLVVEQTGQWDVSLFSDSPNVRTVQLSGKEIHSDQLAVFGRNSETYQVLSQVAAGYFGGNKGKMAVLFQAVLQMRDGYSAIHLNTVLAEHHRRDFTSFLQASEHQQVARSVRKMQKLLSALSGYTGSMTTAEVRSQVEQKAEKIMSDFVGKISRVSRQRERQSHHARMRKQQNRPVAEAMRDLNLVNEENIYHDTLRDTFVVIGRKNRVHIFSRSGVHITSIQLPSSSIQKRLKERRWQPLNPLQAGEWKRKYTA